MKKWLRRFSRDARGQSLVEFALVVPVLILVLLAVIEFGRLWMTVNVISSAAREGARVAAITTPDAGAVQAVAQNVLNGGRVTGGTVALTGPGGANEVTVTVSVNYAPITAGLVPGLRQMVLSRSATMHWEK